jgi:hypothetical protein
LLGAGFQGFVLRFGFVELGLSPGLGTMNAGLDETGRQQDANQHNENSSASIVPDTSKAFQIATLRDFYFRGI